MKLPFSIRKSCSACSREGGGGRGSEGERVQGGRDERSDVDNNFHIYHSMTLLHEVAILY